MTYAETPPVIRSTVPSFKILHERHQFSDVLDGAGIVQRRAEAASGTVAFEAFEAGFVGLGDEGLPSSSVWSARSRSIQLRSASWARGSETRAVELLVEDVGLREFRTFIP
jgi:hypothetical protein